MVALPLVHSFSWTPGLGQRLKRIRKSAHNGKFDDRRDLAAFLAQRGIQCSDSKLKRLEMGISTKAEKEFLGKLLAALGASFEMLFESREQAVQLDSPEK